MQVEHAHLVGQLFCSAAPLPHPFLKLVDALIPSGGFVPQQLLDVTQLFRKSVLLEDSAALGPQQLFCEPLDFVKQEALAGYFLPSELVALQVLPAADLLQLLPEPRAEELFLGDLLLLVEEGILFLPGQLRLLGQLLLHQSELVQVRSLASP